MRLHILIIVSLLVMGAYFVGSMNLLSSDSIITNEKVSTLLSDKISQSKPSNSSSKAPSSQGSLTVQAQQESSLAADSSNGAILNSNISSPQPA